MRWLRGRTKQINSRETCFQPCMELRRSRAPIHTLQTTKCRPSKRQEIRSQKQCLHRSEATSQDYCVHPSRRVARMSALCSYVQNGTYSQFAERLSPLKELVPSLSILYCMYVYSYVMETGCIILFKQMDCQISICQNKQINKNVNNIISASSISSKGG